MTKLAIKKIIISAIVILSTICGALVSTSVFNSVAAIESTSSSSAVVSSSNTTPISPDSYEGLAIYDLDDLVRFRDNVNNGYSYADYDTSGNMTKQYTVTLMADIDMSSIDSWIPIGYSYGFRNNFELNSFQGTFDGNGHIISNLKIENFVISSNGPIFLGYTNTSRMIANLDYYDVATALGLFGYVDNASIKDLMLNNTTIDMTSNASVYGNNFKADITPALTNAIGSLVGAAKGNTTIENCMSVGLTINLDESDGLIYIDNQYGFAAQEVRSSQYLLGVDLSYSCANTMDKQSAGGLVGCYIGDGSNYNQVGDPDSSSIGDNTNNRENIKLIIKNSAVQTENVTITDNGFFVNFGGIVGISCGNIEIGASYYIGEENIQLKHVYSRISEYTFNGKDGYLQIRTAGRDNIGNLNFITDDGVYTATGMPSFNTSTNFHGIYFGGLLGISMINRQSISLHNNFTSYPGVDYTVLDPHAYNYVYELKRMYLEMPGFSLSQLVLKGIDAILKYFDRNEDTGVKFEFIESVNNDVLNFGNGTKNSGQEPEMRPYVIKNFYASPSCTINQNGGYLGNEKIFSTAYNDYSPVYFSSHPFYGGFLTAGLSHMFGGNLGYNDEYFLIDNDYDGTNNGISLIYGSEHNGTIYYTYPGIDYDHQAKYIHPVSYERCGFNYFLDPGTNTNLYAANIYSRAPFDFDEESFVDNEEDQQIPNDDTVYWKMSTGISSAFDFECGNLPDEMYVILNMLTNTSQFNISKTSNVDQANLWNTINITVKDGYHMSDSQVQSGLPQVGYGYNTNVSSVEPTSLGYVDVESGEELSDHSKYPTNVGIFKGYQRTGSISQSATDTFNYDGTNRVFDPLTINNWGSDPSRMWGMNCELNESSSSLWYLPTYLGSSTNVYRYPVLRMFCEDIAIQNCDIEITNYEITHYDEHNIKLGTLYGYLIWGNYTNVGWTSAQYYYMQFCIPRFIAPDDVVRLSNNVSANEVIWMSNDSDLIGKDYVNVNETETLPTLTIEYQFDYSKILVQITDNEDYVLVDTQIDTEDGKEIYIYETTMNYVGADGTEFEYKIRVSTKLKPNSKTMARLGVHELTSFNDNGDYYIQIEYNGQKDLDIMSNDDDSLYLPDHITLFVEVIIPIQYQLQYQVQWGGSRLIQRTSIVYEHQLPLEPFNETIYPTYHYYLEPIIKERDTLEVQFHFNGVSGIEDAKGEESIDPIVVYLQRNDVILSPIYEYDANEDDYIITGFNVRNGSFNESTEMIIYPPWMDSQPVKWTYSIDDGTIYEAGEYVSIGIPYEFVYNADVIHVYITPDYEKFTLNMWADIYGLSGLDDEKSVKFQYNSGDIDLTDSEPDDIVSVGGNLKYFGDWIIGFDGASILDYNGNAINGMSYSYDANSGILDIYYAIPGKTYPEWVQDKWYDGHWSFTVSDIFTALNGNTYYVVTELLSGSWGDMPAKFITAYWSNTYTLHIENDGTEGLGSSIWDNLSNPTNYYGVGGSGSNINVDSNLTELDMTIRHSSTYAYPFMTSEYNNRGLSMRTRDDFERLSATNLPNCNRNYYYIFNYGYRIRGYYISFIYNNRTYYLTYQGGAWGCSSSRTPVYISNLSNDDLADMSLYAERLDELNAGGVPSNTTITMIPIWQAVNIQLTSSNRIWQGRFNTNYNTSSYVNTSLGTTLGYFTAGASGVYIMPSTGNIPYNYYNIPYNLYSNYNRNYSTYTLSISPHQVNNIYRVDLTGYKDKDNYYTLIDDTDYLFVSPTLSTYLITYQDEDGYETYSRAKYRFANDYASYIYDVITDYESDISNGRHDALRKVFVNGRAVTNERSVNSSGVTGMYIYLANNCPTGDLPIFDSTYEILIYWANTETSSNGSRYAYTTSAYNQHDHGIPQYAENSYYATHNQPIWQLTDGYQSISQGSSQIAKVTFEAFYFRKVYYMDVSTAFDNTNDVNQYGYVRIDVNDATEALNTVDDKSADYLVIYLNDGMKYYDVTGMSFSSIADINFNRLTELDELPVYAGCDVTITAYDQSKDSRAMLTGYYFDQIGYKYGEIASNRDVFDSTAYSHSATAEEIDSENMDTGDHINVTVYFDYVNYNLSIRMETGDRTEGTFVVTYRNGAVSGSLTTASLTGLNVNNTVQITYRALSGYEFDDVAFSLLLNGREIELLSYNELKSAGSQTYVLTLDADWLYNIYYINFDTTFSIENTNLGTIQLNTDEIEFDYYVKLINGETNEELENRLLDTWQISDDTVSLANAFTNNGDMGYVIRINGEYYAATYSYAYLPRNPSNMTNHYQSYNFLLTELPNREYSISTDLLSYMTLSTIYEILDEDLRDIYMVVVVRKIVTIQFEVSEVTHDPDGERVVTITNGNSNSKQITVSSNYNTIGTIYSYVGQQNTISLTYNQNMYEGATYTYNDLQIDSSFVATVDGTIIIEFIPKPLNVRVEYYVNDSLQSDISDKLDIEFNHANEVYYCTESNHTDGQIQIIFTQKTQDYDLYIYINDVNQISSYNINTPHVINYRVTRSDVELGEIYIKVVEVEHNNEEITIEFALVDSKLSLPSDNFGSYTVIINDVAVESADSYRVYEGRKLQIQIDLNTGYTYYGVMHNNGLITSLELSDDNIITITTSFTENDGGRYRIYLNKTRINAELRMVGDTHRIYTMDANQSEGDGIVKTTSQDGSVVRLSNLYVGKIITFTRLQDDKYQQLNYYYYVITTSNETIYQTIEGNTLAITSSLLNNIEGDLIIYVNTTNKYMVDLQVIEGSDYANIDYEQFYTNGNFVYFTEGTVIPFIITTIEEGRYDIVVTGDLQCTGDDINTKFTITKDMTIRVSITPKVYNTDDVTEYVFMEISDLENNDPQLVGEEDRNPIMSSNQTYNQEAYVRIDMNLSDRVLYIVKFTCEDIEFTLNLETNEMTANGEFTYENNVLTINSRTYRISITDNLLEISYTSHGDIQLELTYKSVKLIYPAGSND